MKCSENSITVKGWKAQLNCTITDEEWDQFFEDYCGITPCQEYGDCENCPYNEEAEA